MTKWTVSELAYAKGTSEPVRQALLAMHERLNALEAERKWVGLTVEEIQIIEKNALSKEWAVLMTEATLKEKNT